MQDYTTGRAARELGISQSVLRGLCQAGLVAARSSPGGHWRIAKQEVSRLKREGIPDLPPSQPLEGPDTTLSPARHPGLLADPSPEAIAAADEAVRLDSEVKSLGLKRSKAEALDWFRTRRAQRTEAEARQARERIETQADRVRERWEAAWIEYAFSEFVPKDCPKDIEPEVFSRLRERMDELDIGAPRSVVVRLVQAAVETTLSKWRRRQQIESVIHAEVKNGLPTQAQGWSREPSDWDLEAIRKASDAVNLLNSDAPLPKVREVARNAVREVRAQFDRQKAATEHRNMVARVLELVFHSDNAREAVRAALDQLPVGCGYSDMQKAREEALAPFVASDYAVRQADRYLGHIHTYIEELGNESDGEWNLGSVLERWKLAEDLKPKVRARLAKQFLRNEFDREEDLDTQVREFIEECVDSEI